MKTTTESRSWTWQQWHTRTRFFTEFSSYHKRWLVKHMATKMFAFLFEIHINEPTKLWKSPAHIRTGRRLNFLDFQKNIDLLRLGLYPGPVIIRPFYHSHLLSFSSPIILISHHSHLLSFSSLIILISYHSHLLSFSSPIILISYNSHLL